MAKQQDDVSTRSEGSLASSAFTFLFSDIEGSTKRWEAAPVAMADAVRRHDRVMRGSIEAHGGSVFKTVGDAFCAAFQRASEAARAALEAQKRLDREGFAEVGGLSVRIGLHTGEAEQRDNDFFGGSVNRVARLMGIAHGGQAIVSATTQRMLRDDGWDSTRLRDLGVHRLRDLAGEERVFQLLDPDLRQDFPPLRSLANSTHNLPREVTSFVGRDREASDLLAMLSEKRLVTIVGSGGIGKTRLSLHVAASIAERPERAGVWFVELAQLVSSDSVMLAVVTAAGIRADVVDSDRQSFLDALAMATRLLVLDNCEHVIDRVADLVSDILSKCPEIRILCTSRQRLGIRGEIAYALSPLSLPPTDIPAGTPESIEAFESVALFVSRARDVNQRFRLTEITAPIVADVCRHLDGLPLAIELIASRMDVVSPQQLREKLRDKLHFVSRDRDLPSRQRTLQSLIDWSYELLSDREKLLFGRLAVFAGGFTLEAAESVVPDDSLAVGDIFECLLLLVEKSLIVADPEAEGGVARYRFIEAVHEYSQASYPRTDEIAKRFAAWVGDLARSADRTWLTQKSITWDTFFGAEIENIRAALRWTLEETRDIDLGCEIVARLRYLWGRVAPAEGLKWVELAREKDVSEDGSARRGELCLTEAQIRVALRQYRRAYTVALEAITILDPFGSESLELADARRFAGFALSHIGEPDRAMELLASVAQRMRTSGSAQLIAYAVQDLAMAHVAVDDLDAAREYFGEALIEFERAENYRGMAATRANLAEIAFMCGRPHEAVEIASELTGDPLSGVSAAHVSANLAGYHIAIGSWDEAKRHVRRALDVSRGEDDMEHVLIAAQHAAVIDLERRGDPSIAADLHRVAALMGFSNRQLEQRNLKRGPNEERLFQRAILLLREELGTDRFGAEYAAGAAWQIERGIIAART